MFFVQTTAFLTLRLFSYTSALLLFLLEPFFFILGPLRQPNAYNTRLLIMASLVLSLKLDSLLSNHSLRFAGIILFTSLLLGAQLSSLVILLYSHLYEDGYYSYSD